MRFLTLLEVSFLNIGTASELDAVNELLAAIGEDPVESLDIMPPSGNTALVTLRSANTAIQAEGHWFNQTEDVTFYPDGNTKEIYLPPNALAVYAAEQKYIKRGARLFDRENKTYKFNNSVDCTVVYQLPWDELPNSAQRYITATAIETFVDGMPAEMAVSEARKRNFLRALVAFRQDDMRNGNYSLLDNQSVTQLMSRD